MTVTCRHCKCAILPHHEREMTSMTGPFGSVIIYWHEDANFCVRMLKRKVRRLERFIGRRAVRQKESQK